MIHIYDYQYHQIIKCPHCNKLLDADLAKDFCPLHGFDGGDSEHECDYCYQEFHTRVEVFREEIYVCRLPFLLVDMLYNPKIIIND